MSMEKARAYLAERGLESRIMEFEASTATVELAAQAAGVIPARIAKTLCFRDGDGCMLIVAAGDARIDNRKFKDRFGRKASMPGAEEVEHMVGHAVGGVCPFGRNEGIPVYIDESVKRFETVLPAVGTAHSAIELNIQELYEVSEALEWVDVCKLPEA